MIILTIHDIVNLSPPAQRSAKDIAQIMPATTKAAASKAPAKPVGPPPFLNRYTSLPIALNVLSKKHITLLSPETWDDRNDAYYVERYRDERKLRSILAICFSLHRETFHHWRIFSNGSSGVCIEFDKEKLLESIPDDKAYRHGNVTYKWISELEKKKPELETWPFLKRKPFEDEREYRIIFESKTESLRASQKAPELVAEFGALELMKRLFDASIIGVRLGNAGTARFRCEDSDLLLPTSGSVYIHQSLYKGLSIRETRAA
jgi:hypothetical protein